MAKSELYMFARCMFEALGEFLAELDEQDNDGHPDYDDIPDRGRDVDTTIGMADVDYITAEDDD